MRFFIALWLYRLIFLLLTPVILGVLCIRSISHSAYRQRLLERLGFISPNFVRQGIIVHAASVGEVLALKPFITQLIKDYPSLAITVTTFTPTGSAQVKKLFGAKVQHCFLPLDNILSTSLFLNTLQPKAIIFMETELWPNFIAQAKKQKIKLLLINGRLSNKSITRYKKLSWLITPTVQRFDKILTQSQVNQENYLSIGANLNNCSLSGNLKFDMAINADIEEKVQTLNTYITPVTTSQMRRKIWLVASTHPGDEALALTVFESLKQQHSELLLVIVPRHPERFSQVSNLCKKAGFTVVKRSEKTPVLATTDVWVIDTLGELLSVCALADIVTMGGSFSDIGGHNPLEPALFEKPVIVGPNMSNFSEILAQLSLESGILQITDETNFAQQLHKTVDELLVNENKALKIGKNAYKVVLANQGATVKSLSAVKKLVPNAE